MGQKLAVISLWCEDVAAATRFYRDVIGLRLLFHHGGKPHFDVDCTYLVILKGHTSLPTDTINGNFPVVAFQISDLDSTLIHLKKHNIDLPWGIEEDPTGRWVKFYDPGGNLIELIQYKIP